MKYHSRIFIAAVVLLLTAVLSLAQDPFYAMDLTALAAQAKHFSMRLDKKPSDYEALRGLGTVRYHMAVRDAQTYLKEAIRTLEQALKAKPDDDGAICYLGSAYLIMARDESDPALQMSHVGQGQEMMDKAVKESPDDISIRMIRGYTTRAMPVFLGRRPTAYEDFEYIAALIEKGAKVQPSFKALLYGTLAAMYQEDANFEKAAKYQALVQKAGE